MDRPDSDLCRATTPVGMWNCYNAMMLVPLLAITLHSTRLQPIQSSWERTASTFRSIAETYKKWGITFEVDGTKKFTSADGPLPGHLELSGSLETPDTLKLKMKVTGGDKEALAIDLGGSFSIDPSGNASEGGGAVYIENSGLGGKFKYDATNGLTLETGLEETFYTLGLKFGNPQEGPIGFGLKLGPLTVNVNPTIWARHAREAIPAMAKVASGKIGGVTLNVDMDAMAAALVNDPTPPDRFLKDRLAVSLKSVTASQKDLGDLNDIEGIFIDSAHEDLLLVGSHDPNLPPVSLDILAALARTVYEAGTHPYISLDPQAGNLMAPHHARIGGVPDDLRSSELIKVMLTADYSMKQIQLGQHPIDGVPDLMELVEKDKDPSIGGAGRFWINPRPLAPGDVRLSSSEQGRFYSVMTFPLVSCESTLSGPEMPSLMSANAPRERTSWDREVELVSRSLTEHYGQVEHDWPEAQFGAARQTLQLSNLLSLARNREKTPWADAVIHAIASREIPKTDVPSEFPGLRSPRSAEIGNITTWIQGGMTTDVELPEPENGDEPLAAPSMQDGVAKLHPREPAAAEPAPLTEDQVAAGALTEARRALRAKDYVGAADAARDCLLYKPNLIDALVIRVEALANVDESLFDLSLQSALKAQPDAWQLIYFDGLYAEDKSKSVAGGFGDQSGFQVQALEDAKRVIKQQPLFSPGYALLARACHYLEDEQESLDAWDKALATDPYSVDNHLGKAAVLVATAKPGDSNLDKALAEIDAAQRLSPMTPNIFLVRGELLRSMNRVPEAIANLEAATRLNPADWLAFDILGQMRLACGDNAGAIEAFNIAIFRRPQDTMSKSIEEAQGTPYLPVLHRIPIDPFVSFVKRFGDAPRNVILDIPLIDEQLWLQRGKAHYHLGHWKEALADFGCYATLNPGKAREVANLIKACKEKAG